MEKEGIKKIFAEKGAIITNDHFVYAKKADGWHHGGDYANKDAIYPFTRIVSAFCKEIADHFWGSDIKVVVGPTVGGVALAQWTAYWYYPPPNEKEILAVYADEEDVFEEMTGGQGRVKVGTTRVLKRGYDKIVAGKLCLVVEDVINTGATVKKTIEAIKAAGGEVYGVGALANRSGGKVTAETLGVPELFSLLDLDMKMYKEEECPICKERGPKSVRTDLGKGKEFLTRIGA